MRSLGLLLTCLLCAAPARAGLNLGVAVMDPRTAGLADADVANVMEKLRGAMQASLRGTDFVVAPVDALRKAQAEMTGCRVGTCDMQVARRQGSVAVLSVEVALSKGEHSVNMRLFETRDGGLLARQLVTHATLDGAVKQLGAAVKELVTALQASHKAAVEAMRGGEKVYRLVPAAMANATATTSTPKQDGRKLVEDGDSVGLPRLLAAARPEVNACYDQLLAKKPKARGRMMLSVDVEPSGQVSTVDILEDELGNVEMQACVKARVGRVKFGAAKDPWRIRFPLVFVRSAP